ncbi:MAG: hypothetical protein RBU21_02955 [FCB group bacterium]|jgi:hypothetical protein|nr:hypothetical protein [FCB group bacterium]
MKNPLAWIGGLVVAMGVIGALDLADFRLCFGPVGYCNPPLEKDAQGANNENQNI